MASPMAVRTSSYRGSPSEPGSLVRSSTAMAFTVAGSAPSKCSTLKGRNRRTLSRPTFSPCAIRWVTTSSMASAPEPIMITIRSASGAPT